MGYYSVTPPHVEAPTKNHLSLWRLSEPVLNDKRVVTRGGMWKPQRDFWELPNFIKVMVGGYGCGKTNVFGKRIISLALENAPYPVATVSPTYSIAKETVIVTLMELLAGKQTLLGRDVFRWWMHKSIPYQFFIRYHGRKARIICYSGDEPMSLRGPNLAAAGIDEPFIQDVEVFKQMNARVRHPMAKRLEILCTGTPEQLNWGYDLCLKDGQFENVDVGFVRAPTSSNLALPSTYLTNLAATFSGKEADAYIEGDFVNIASGLVFHAYSPTDNKLTGTDLPPYVRSIERLAINTFRFDGHEIVVPQAAHLGAGMDFNVDPMSAAVFWTMGNHVHFFDEIELPNADTEYMCDLLRERYKGDLQDIYPDPSGNQRRSSAPGGKTDFYYIRKAGYTIHAPSQGYARRDSFNAVNGKLKNRKGEVTCTISERCKKLTKYLATYSHDLMNRREQKAMSHLLDAFRYPITNLFPVVRGTPVVTKLGGV